MEKYSLTTTLSNPARSRPVLIIEQEEYGSTDGFLSRGGLHRALFDLLNGEVIQDPDCVPGCGTFINVYRYNLSLAYQLYASHGSLGERIVQDDLVYIEKIECRMELEKSLKYPNFGIVGWRWLADKTWDRDGQEISPPAFESGVDYIRFAQEVYGTIAVSYRINRDRYTLSLPLREEAEENKFSSVVYAVHDGGPTWKTINAPPGAEETEQQCFGGGGGGGGEWEGPEESGPPTAPNRDARQVRDYCTQEVISDTSKHD